ncbi:ATP-dependent OLD family endonuclease domain protein [Helicobacter pylori CPY6261]|nr:ATP-dependent OLD family endonuclease domain protein [Helicobacter pylori CPY6261]
MKFLKLLTLMKNLHQELKFYKMNNLKKDCQNLLRILLKK